MKAIKEGNDVRNIFKRRNNKKRCLVRIVLRHCQVISLLQKLMSVSFVYENNQFSKRITLEEGRLKKAEELLIGAYWKLSKHNPNEKQANNMTHKGEVLDER